jgi:hypothetical protein
MMPLCPCCQSEPIAHSVYTASEGMVHVCNRCFLKLDGRLFDQRVAQAKRACEIEKLEYWATFESEVNR